jgi:hypothetical protein
VSLVSPNIEGVSIIYPFFIYKRSWILLCLGVWTLRDVGGDYTLVWWRVKTVREVEKEYNAIY